MPRKQYKVGEQVGPSPSLLQRIFGGPLSSSTAQQWPELQQKWAGRELEMPEETAATSSVRPFNFIERALMPQASGITWPWGTIALNRPQIEAQQKMTQGDELADTLVHELTHVGQRKKSGLARHLLETMGASPSYRARPYEAEAFHAEYNRPVRKRDINLPSMKKK